LELLEEEDEETESEQDDEGLIAPRGLDLAADAEELTRKGNSNSVQANKANEDDDSD
jgi:hypothetical protein